MQAVSQDLTLKIFESEVMSKLWRFIELCHILTKAAFANCNAPVPTFNNELDYS